MTSSWRILAETLVAEHRDRKPFRPFAAGNAIKTIADAYAAQREYVSLRQDNLGSPRAGYKIGLTSKAMQTMCGIDTPVSGAIFADHVFPSPAHLQRLQYGRLGLEFEIAVRMGKDLCAQNAILSTDEVADAVDGVSAAIELVDDRNCDYATLDVLSLIVDNAWNAGIVLGPFVTRWPDLAQVQGIVAANGAEIGRGVGADALGHPFVPLTWLANQLISDGSYLKAGDIIMTGSLIKTQFPSIATQFDYELEGIGHVFCHVA